MPRNVEIEVFLLAKSVVDDNAARKWLEQQGVSSEGRVRLTDRTEHSDADMLVELAGRRCYKSFEVGLNPNVSKIRDDVTKYIDNILASKHGSVTEHISFTFAIENVSRVFTGEMNRHRAGMAISEGSMRYIRFDNIAYWCPTSIRYTEEELDSACADESERPLIEKKKASQEVFRDVFAFVEKKYAELCEIWKDELAPESKFKAKKDITSMMRRIVPMGVATGGIWTGNIRALRHIFTMRCSPLAEEEILLVGTKMLNMMRASEPNFFGDFETDAEGFSKPKHVKV